jgi:hypothetical protein
MALGGRVAEGRVRGNAVKDSCAQSVAKIACFSNALSGEYSPALARESKLANPDNSRFQTGCAEIVFCRPLQGSISVNPRWYPGVTPLAPKELCVLEAGVGGT